MHSGKKKLNKKGSLQDLIILGVVFLTFAISILLGFRIMSDLQDKTQDIPLIANNLEATQSTATLVGSFTGVFDNAFLFLVIGASIASLVLASLVRVHPIFIPFFILGLVFVVFLSGIASNIYQEMAANTELVDYADQLTFVSLIMGKLPFFVGIIGTVLMVVTYKLWQNSQEF